MNKKRNILLILAIVFAAFNLRSPITGVGSLVSIIKTELNLSGSSAGIITTIPLITFAIASPFISSLSKKFSARQLMLYSLITLAFGIVVRSYTGTAGLFIGTAIIGTGISVGNVLLPSIIKSQYPDKVGMMTSIYTTAMTIFAGVSSGISVPLAIKAGLGWKNALAVWLILTVITIAIWILQRNLQLEEKKAYRETTKKNMYKSSVAWSVTLYMGTQSLLFYCFVAWLPTILQAKGIHTEIAGYYASAYQFMGIPASFSAPLLAVRKRNQKALAGIISFVYALGLMLFLFADNTILIAVSVLICGFCSGACISLAMSLIGLRSCGAQEAASLSGMSQAIGYSLAAVGPFIMGVIFDIWHSWNVPIICLIVMAVFLLPVSLKAGEERTV